MLRIAAIGYGDIARRRHFPDIQALGERADLVALVGRDPAALRACGEEFGVTRLHTDAEAVLADPDIDAVLVLTPPDSHAEYASHAIAAGKHVLIEKPLVGTAAEAAALLDVLRRQQARKPITCFPLPHVETEELRLVRDLLAGGAIGTPTVVEAHRGHRGPTHAGWFYEKRRSGGGVLIDLGIYQLTTLVALFGPALRMTASCTRFFAERALDDGSAVRPDVEDSAMLTLAMADGLAAGVTATWNGCLSHRETRGRILVVGREGHLYFGGMDRLVYVHRPDGDWSRVPAPTIPARFDGYDCRRILTDGDPPLSIAGAFVQRILDGDTATRAMQIQAHVLEIVERAYMGDGGTALASAAVMLPGSR